MGMFSEIAKRGLLNKNPANNVIALDGRRLPEIINQNQPVRNQLPALPIGGNTPDTAPPPKFVLPPIPVVAAPQREAIQTGNGLPVIPADNAASKRGTFADLLPELAAQVVAPRTESGNGIDYKPLPVVGDTDTFREMNSLNTAEDNVRSIQSRDVTNKDRGKWGWVKEFLGNAAANASNAPQDSGFGGMLGSAIGGGISGAIDRTQNERRGQARDLGRAMQTYGVEKQLEDERLNRRGKIAQITNAEQRPEFEQQKLDQKGRELDERGKANSMRVVASVYNRLPSFDSKDPNNADVVAQMQALGIPVVDKNPNKDVKYVQDEDSGEMFIVSTDKQTGETSAEQVMQNGQPLKITTKSQIGMRVKELDRTSREKIAEARNNTLLKVTGINAGSRERVAEMNVQGAGDRVDKQIKAADERQKTQLFNTSFSRWQQQFQKTNFRAPNNNEIQQAQESIRKTIYGQ